MHRVVLNKKKSTNWINGTASASRWENLKTIASRGKPNAMVTEGRKMWRKSIKYNYRWREIMKHILLIPCKCPPSPLFAASEARERTLIYLFTSFHEHGVPWCAAIASKKRGFENGLEIWHPAADDSWCGVFLFLEVRIVWPVNLRSISLLTPVDLWTTFDESTKNLKM